MESLQENGDINEEAAPIDGEQVYHHFYVSNERHGSDYFAPDEQVTKIINNFFFEVKIVVQRFLCNLCKFLV